MKKKKKRAKTKKKKLAKKKPAKRSRAPRVRPRRGPFQIELPLQMPLFHIEEQRAPPPVDVPATTEAPEGGDGPGPTAENFQPLLLAPSMLP